MTYTVKSGDSASAIAASHGISLSALIAANPALKANPNQLAIGQILVIPGADAAPPLVIDVTKLPAGLGSLSENFESGGRGPGTVSSGVGDWGGVSYGVYQFTSKPQGGTVAVFVAVPDFPWRANFAGLTPGSAEFSAAWKAIATSDAAGFRASQHGYIETQYFVPIAQRTYRAIQLDVTSRSLALMNVFWSTAVQHGPSTSIITTVYGAAGDPAFTEPEFDADLITAIYAERGRKNAAGQLVHFPNCSAEVQKSLINRFATEEKAALAMLSDAVA